MKEGYITAHEPDEELLGPKDLEEDVATLDRFLAEKRKVAILSELDPETWHLLEELVSRGYARMKRKLSPGRYVPLSWPYPRNPTDWCEDKRIARSG